MNTHTDKSQENKMQAVAYSLTKKQGNRESTFQFVDNRAGSVAQRQVQEVINNSPRMNPLNIFQKMERESTIKQLKNYKTNSDNYAFEVAQRKGELKEALQGKIKSIKKKNNTTGLPSQQKAGIENYNGQSMGDGKVNYGSSHPSRLQTYSYMQGSDIHVPNEHEKYLSHKAWTRVQPKQGGVPPKTQMKGNLNINSDDSLVDQADLMGKKASSNLSIKEFGESYHCGQSKGVSQFAAIMTGVLGKPGRKKRMMSSADLIGSGSPYVYIKPDFKMEGGKRNVVESEVWKGNTTEPIGQSDHIDIFGHSSAGNPGGLALAPLVNEIESILVFPDEGWKGDIRLFSCFAAQSLGGDDKTRTIVELGGEIDKSSRQKMKGVTAIAGPSTEGNLGYKTGAVLALSNTNIAVRKYLNASTTFELLGEIKAKRVANEYALDLTEKEIEMANKADFETLCQIIFTGINRNRENSAWWISQRETEGWKSTKQALVGDNPGQVSSLIGGGGDMLDDESDEHASGEDNPEKISASEKDNLVQIPKLEETIPITIDVNVRHEPNKIPSNTTSKESVSILINVLDNRINYLKIRKSQFAADIAGLKERAGYVSSRQTLEKFIKKEPGKLKALAERLGEVNVESNAEEVRTLIVDIDKVMGTVK